MACRKYFPASRRSQTNGNQKTNSAGGATARNGRQRKNEEYATMHTDAIVCTWVEMRSHTTTTRKRYSIWIYCNGFSFSFDSVGCDAMEKSVALALNNILCLDLELRGKKNLKKQLFCCDKTCSVQGQAPTNFQFIFIKITSSNLDIVSQNSKFIISQIPLFIAM